MFIKKKFILGVLYLSAATAQGKLGSPAIDSFNTFGVDAAEQTELREVATYAGGQRVALAGHDSLPFDAAASAVEADRRFGTTSAPGPDWRLT